MMKKVWKLREVLPEQLEKLRYTGFPDIFLKILINRGICDENSIERYFSPKVRYLFSPFVLNGVCDAINRIFNAIEKEEGIRVYGDRDVDGITSTVVLLETLRSFSKLVDYTIPVIEDGYGLNPSYIDVAVRDGIRLIVTVDCGISNIDEVEYAKNNGIDIIITDHHEPPDELPKAVAIVNPKLYGSCCPQKNIAGVGVAFKLAIALELARSDNLSKPLLGFDLSNHDISVVKFSPRTGFQNLKNLDKSTISGCIPVYFSEEERKLISEIMPETLQHKNSAPTFEPIFIDKMLSDCMPEEAKLSKNEIKKSLNLSNFEGAKAVLLMYLKCLESKLPAIKNLWQRCLDMLTIGTIADMVPMYGENRSFTQMGLKFVEKSKRLGLNCLFNALGWKNRQVTERDISFNIAPVLNSSGRLKTAELAIELLSTSFAPKAEELAKELFELNSERKRLGEECYQTVKKILLEQNDVENERILLVIAPIKNQGVTGIVATRLMLDYCRPVVVLLEDQGKFIGSARSFKNINIIEALNHCAPHLEKFGGHIGAAGLTMPMGNEDIFRTTLREYANKNIDTEALQPEWLIDSEIDINKVDESFLDDLLNFAPFGIENPAPIFMTERTQFVEIRKVGETKNHLRFKFRRSNGRNLFGIGFNLGEIISLDQVRDGVCDMVFHVEPNDYNGVRSAQLMILDCRIRGFK